ncbi:anti-sigma-F factor Fin family protein [Alteribacillus sp. YIM 98480]|uniref:anti-sigma-F factor Fin family protein n=1 Tax=Alteribacillus sp. YIM 98480 TaxID=2606599 RepID=UPI00131AA88B|nr:anti-sigma-F factor Fin family protein [Alteribacillus sp. YIM 98480]
MAIQYYCRHCGTSIGTLEDEELLVSPRLGFDQLTDEEQQQIIHYGSDGNVHVRVTCENCEEALENNPHFHELDRWIH